MSRELAFTWALALMPLILAHEYAHAWASACCGYAPRRVSVGFGRVVARVGLIELRWLILGGSCETDVFVRGSPAQQALVAVAGPAANLVCAAVLAFAPAPLSHAAWLSAGMAVANLLPFPPLDGGRVLVAALRAAGVAPRAVRWVQDAGLAVVAGLHAAVLGVPLGGEWPAWMAAAGAAGAAVALVRGKKKRG